MRRRNGCGSNPNVYALRTSDGKSVWSTLVNGIAGAPVVAGGILYVGGPVQSAHGVSALDAASGASLWQSPDGQLSGGFAGMAGPIVALHRRLVAAPRVETPA